MRTGMTKSNQPLSICEVSFIHSHSRDLVEAWRWCRRYQKASKAAMPPNVQEIGEESSYIQQAWDIYYRVFKNVQPQKIPLSEIELKFTSPWLYHANNLQISVPCPVESTRWIVKFNEQQCPAKCCIHR